jgi:hypothetical protein
MGDYRHGDCCFLSALASWYASTSSSSRELLGPVTITHIAFVKSDAVYDPYATTEAWLQKMEVEFEFGDFDRTGHMMMRVVRRRQTLLFRRYSAATLASFF